MASPQILFAWKSTVPKCEGSDVSNNRKLHKMRKLVSFKAYTISTSIKVTSGRACFKVG